MDYSTYRIRSYVISEQVYNYMLAAMRKYLGCRRFEDGTSQHYFIGTPTAYADFQRRLIYLDD